MRILTITNLYPNPAEPTRGVFNRHQVHALAREHAVDVISPVAWTDQWRLWRRGRRLPSDRVSLLDGVRAEHPRYLFVPRLGRAAYGRQYRRSIARVFARVLDRARPDVIFAPWAYPDGWAAVELAHEAGIPAVIKVHGSDLLLLDRFPDRFGPTAEALCRADAVVAVSRDLGERVARMGTDRRRVHVVYDGVETNLFRPGPRDRARQALGLPQDGTMLLFVGNLLPVKGPDVLLKACAKLMARGRSFACHLVGQGPLHADLRRTARVLHLDHIVTLDGVKPHQDLPDWYRAADAVVLPSRSEGVPCVLLEAAACRRPFVASRVGGIPEIAHLTPNRLVTPDSPDLLAEALDEAIAGQLEPPRCQRPYRRDHAEAAAELVDVFGRAMRWYRGEPLTEWQGTSAIDSDTWGTANRARTSLATAPAAVLAESVSRSCNGCAGCRAAASSCGSEPVR